METRLGEGAGAQLGRAAPRPREREAGRGGSGEQGELWAADSRGNADSASGQLAARRAAPHAACLAWEGVRTAVAAEARGQGVEGGTRPAGGGGQRREQRHEGMWVVCDAVVVFL